MKKEIIQSQQNKHNEDKIEADIIFKDIFLVLQGHRSPYQMDMN